jgi:hypothetical protein
LAFRASGRFGRFGSHLDHDSLLLSEKREDH